MMGDFLHRLEKIVSRGILGSPGPGQAWRLAWRCVVSSQRYWSLVDVGGMVHHADEPQIASLLHPGTSAGPPAAAFV